MILFSDDDIAMLASHLVGQFIRSVSLATHGFTLEVDDIVVDGKERVFASINGERYEWDEAPNAGPWGLLVGQTINGLSVPDPNRLRIELASGDYVELETVQSRFESVAVQLPSDDGQLVMAFW